MVSRELDQEKDCCERGCNQESTTRETRSKCCHAIKPPPPLNNNKTLVYSR